MKSIDFQSYLAQADLDAKPHQAEGEVDAGSRETPHMGVCGGIIADEMGLGKTILDDRNHARKPAGKDADRAAAGIAGAVEEGDQEDYRS